MFVEFMTDLRKSVASMTFRAQVQVPQTRPTMPQRIMLSGPADTPDTRPMRAVPTPEPYEEDELVEDRVAAAMGGARQIRRPVSAGGAEMTSTSAMDVRRLNTNRGEEGAAPVHKPVTAEPKVGRNDPCPCGSGKKYKKCHGVGLV
jgi:preprotein translocase subunit SecA